MTKNKPSILLIDDDAELCTLLAEFLAREGFTVDAVYCGQDALNLLQKDDQFDAIVLDIMMPEISGLTVLQRLREYLATPILMLTGRGDDIDRIIGLEMGADDYLAKPCNPRELAARLRAVLRRTAVGATPQKQLTSISLHGIHLDIGKRDVLVNGQALIITGTEFNILARLMQAAGETVSKEQLTEDVLHRKLSQYDRSIDVHVSRVRQKLAKYLSDKTLIKTVRGVGYQFINDTHSNLQC